MKTYDTFDLNFILDAMPTLLKSLKVTAFISIFAFLFGCLLGLLLTFGKISKWKAVRTIVNTLTILFRGIPTVVLLYLVYFGLPALVQQIFDYNISNWDKQIFVIIALSIELAVTCSEMFRSAYNSLDKGQLEAAHSIGMTKVQSFFRVILPQAVYVILPNLGNAAISMIQGTVLVYTLGIMDVMFTARVLDTNAMHLKTFEAYLAVAVIYWIISILIGELFRLAERLMEKGQRTIGNTGN